MNKLLTVLLVASIAGPVLSDPVLADPGFLAETWMVARKDNDQDRHEDRDLRKFKQQSSKKKQERIENEQEDRGYGYGYERRNPERPDRVYDDRGRR